MSQVLYFPNLSLPDAGWVNPAILFFDRIGVISPEDSDSQKNDLFDERTKALVNAKVVKPVWPGAFYYLGSTTEAAFLQILLKRAETMMPISDQWGDLHVGKFRHTELLERLIYCGLVRRTESDSWVVAPLWLADELMNYLALQLSCSPNLGMDLVTDSGPAWTRMTGHAVEEFQADRRLQAVTSLLPVAHDVDVDDLLKFRDRRKSELLEFRNYVEALVQSVRPSEVTATVDFEMRLKEAERCRKELVRSLEAMRWQGAIGRVFVSALPMASSLADHSPWSAMAGLVPLGIQLRQEWKTQRAGLQVKRDPLAYAALAQVDLRTP